MDQQLIERIVKQVVAAVGQGQASPSQPALKPLQAAPVGRAEAPIGPTKLFVTAEMLDQRLAAGVENNMLQLAHNEYLTPNARDVADKRRVKIRRLTEPIAQPADAAAPVAATACSQVSPIQNANPAVGLVVARGDAKVATTLSALRRSGMEMVDFGQTDCWIENIKGLGGAIVSGRVGCGVAILPEAAGAAMLANKIRGILAIQGMRGDAVAAAVRRLAPNLLILEHVSLTFHEMRVMIGSFIAQPAAAPTDKALISAVGEAEAN